MLIEFLITALIIELTPGPNMAWLSLLGASRGSRIALISVIGISLGLTFAASISAFGVNFLFSEHPFIFQILRFLGFIYLVYLAWDSWNFFKKKPKEKYNENRLRYFTQGFLTNILNPKAYIFYTTVIPQFITEKNSALTQLFTLSIIYIIIATIIHVIIALLAGKFNKFFSNGYRVNILGKSFSILLIFTAIWFLYSTR